MRTYKVTVAVTLVGYSAWFVVGVLRGVRPSDLMAVIQGQPCASFDLEGPDGARGRCDHAHPGRTSRGCTRRDSHRAGRSDGRQAIWRHSFWRWRAPVYFLSERLAILELLLPALVALLVSARRDGERGLTRLLRGWFPIVYLAGAASMFLAFEFNRSWAHYRLTNPNGYLDFAIDRFVGYYTTSVNNGALLYDGLLGARPTLFSLQWLAEFPVVGSLLRINEGRMPLNELLIGHANPEFNTEGALLAPAIDFGMLPSLFVWFLLGIAAAVVYRRVRAGEVAWLPLSRASTSGSWSPAGTSTGGWAGHSCPSRPACSSHDI
ncbi:MAG: hypothetical protein M5U19_00595 [Microthrixaceae bacterium]|nr:hypothetical protein [Microthrixaceae bacterium]